MGGNPFTPHKGEGKGEREQEWEGRAFRCGVDWSSACDRTEGREELWVGWASDCSTVLRKSWPGWWGMSIQNCPLEESHVRQGCLALVAVWCSVIGWMQPWWQWPWYEHCGEAQWCGRWMPSPTYTLCSQIYLEGSLVGTCPWLPPLHCDKASAEHQLQAEGSLSDAWVTLGCHNKVP